jgi:hypothetical protein
MLRLVSVFVAVTVAATAARAAPECGLAEFRDLLRWKGNESTCTAATGPCTHNAEEVAALFNPFAIASVGAYYSDADKTPATNRVATGRTAQRAKVFQLETFDPAYQSKGYIDEADSGLGMRVHHKRLGDQLSVVVAFRGTDKPTNWADMMSNFSWFTQWFRSNDQYKRARFHFEKIKADAEATPGIKKIAYITTGHSLGGGLARHVAHAFPCTAAVAFDSSPVTNEFVLAKSYPAQVVVVHERGDVLSGASNTGAWFGGLWDRITGKAAANTFRRYDLELLKDKEDQHKIEPFATNMARLQICCAQRQHWATLQKDAKTKRENRCSSVSQDDGAVREARQFYCENFRRLRAGAVPAGDVCDFSSDRRGEQCGLRKLIDGAKP